MTFAANVLITGDRLLLGDNDKAGPGYIAINKDTGKIVKTENGRKATRDEFPDAEFIDAGSKYVFPGLVDAHVHLNEPGRTDWEGFYTGTTAATAGGITTVAEMPLNSIPPTTTVENLEIKKHAAEGQLACDVVFWGGVIPGNADDIGPLAKAGVRGFKCFLCESGVDEFPCVNEQDIRKAGKEITKAQSKFLFHAEFDRDNNVSCCMGCNATSDAQYAKYLNSRPDKFEVDAVEIIGNLLSEEPELNAHIVHVSSAQVLPKTNELREKQKRKLSLETCVHYLVLDSDDIPDGETLYKCAPPIRDLKNQEKLWDALFNNEIDFIVSDHSPSTRELKFVDEGDFMRAWGGISTLGLGLPLIWTAAQKRKASVRQVIDWMSSRPAAHVGLGNKKGKLAEGYDADVCIFDAESQWTITAEDLLFKNKQSPYVGKQVKGAVDMTILRGNVAYTRGQKYNKDSSILYGQAH